jgi:hypothetical protein
MRPGEVPIGTCVRVVPGMVWADRYCVSDLMRDDGRDRHDLVAHRAVSHFDFASGRLRPVSPSDWPLITKSGRQPDACGDRDRFWSAIPRYR